MYISVEELQFLHDTRRLDEKELEQYFHSPMDCIKFLLENHSKTTIDELRTEVSSLENDRDELEYDIRNLEQEVSNLENQVKLLEKGK